MTDYLSPPDITYLYNAFFSRNGGTIDLISDILFHAAYLYVHAVLT